MSLEPRFRHTCHDALEDNSLLCRDGSNILPLPCGTFNLPSHTSTVGVSGRTPLEFGGWAQGWCFNFRIRATQSMPKRKHFNRRALSCTSTRMPLEGRRSVELMDLRFKPVRASRVQGFQGPYGGSRLVLTLHRIYIYIFFKCVTVYLNWWKTGMRGYFLFTTALSNDTCSGVC